MEYEVIIVAAPKDYNKVKYAIAYAKKYLVPQPLRYHLITPTSGRDFFSGSGIDWHDEQAVLPLNTRLSKFKRPLWVYQQFLKLGQNVTLTDFYLIIDSDLILLKPINVWNDVKPQFFIGANDTYTPDIATMEKLWNLTQVYPESFISEMMMMNKVISRDILDRIGGLNKAYCKVCDLIPYDGTTYRFSEYQLYGNFVHKYHPGMYDFRRLNVRLIAQFGEYTDEHIEKLISAMNVDGLEAFTYHTWVEND